MSRIVNPKKLEDIKMAIIELVAKSKYNFDTLSVSIISKKSGVSEGYLYRHYRGKEELFNDIIGTEFNNLINDFRKEIQKSDNIYTAVYNTIQRLFFLANEKPIIAKFSAIIALNQKIISKLKRNNLNKYIMLAKELIELGNRTGEINKDVTPIEVLTYLFIPPFQYLDICLDFEKNKVFTIKEVERIAKMSIKALQ